MSSLESVLKRDRTVVIVGLAAIAGLAWAYTAYLALGMPDAGVTAAGTGVASAMPRMHAWGGLDLLLTFTMWSVMMVAMMVPSAAPMVLLVAARNRERHSSASPFAPTALFLLGYLLVWTGFSAAATGLQWGLHTAALLSPMMASTSPILGGFLLAAAGVFQFTPLKRTCLSRCRSPLHFFLGARRDRESAPTAMGLKHGMYCVGCCWVLMSLLFVAGVMNLLWVAAITVFVLVERVVPAGDVVGRVTGVALILAGVLIASGTLPTG